MFDLREPFYLGEKDQSPNVKDVASRYPKTFVDQTTSGSIAKAIKVEYSQERDLHQLMTISNKGSYKNPVWNYEPAQYMDPLSVQNRGLARIINSTMMQDVKFHSMNKWLTDAEPWLKAKSNEIWHSPYTHFASIQKSDFRSDTPRHIVRALLNNHTITQNFLGLSNEVDNALHHIGQVATDAIFQYGGRKVAHIPKALLPYAKSPTPVLRTLAADAYLGLGSPQAFFTQASAHVNIWGLSPRSAPAATMSMLMHKWAYFNNTPEVLAEIDRRMTQMALPGTRAFRPGQWTELYNLGRDSGFMNIKETHALGSDAPMSAKLVESGGRKILDWGRTPFTVGATDLRRTALSSAYLEFREKNPTGRLTRGNISEILNRARLLDHDMNRSANSTLHTGWASLPGQFFAYDLRIAEIMWGKRIAPMDKARFFIANSAAFGIRVGGLGLFGIPLYHYLQKRAVEDYGNITGAKDKLTDFLVNGAPSAIMNSITGHSYNIAKFGAHGIQYLEDALYSDHPFWKMIGGAGVGFLMDAFENSNHFFKSVLPEALGGVKDMKIKAAYVAQSMDTLTGFRDFHRIWTAAHAGKWHARNGAILADDISVPNAIFMGLTGVTENQFTEKYIKDELLRDQDQKERTAFTLATAEWVRAAEADANQDPEQAKYFRRSAFGILTAAGFPEHRWSQAIATMNRGIESTISKTNQRYMLEAPAGKEKERAEQFKQENQ
jgi:hypothetical protein